MSPRLSSVKLILAMLLLLAIFIGILTYFGAYDQILRVLDWIHTRSSNMQLLLFVLLMAAVVIFVLPGVMFTLGAGFIFGVAKGTFFVVLGTTLGASLAFLLARYTFAKSFKDYLLSHPKLQTINAQCESEGWKIVLATRLIPFFPFKLSNYFFGLTSFSFRDFVFGTSIGIVPYSLYNVYLGSIAANLSNLNESSSRTSIEWSFYGLGFVLSVLALFYFRRLARKIMASSGQPDKLRSLRIPGKPMPDTDYRDYI